MFHKRLSIVAILSIVSLILVTGCGQQTVTEPQAQPENIEATPAAEQQPANAEPAQPAAAEPQELPKAELKLTFQEGETDTYKVHTSTVQSYEFAEPSIEKVKQEKTGADIRIVFDRTVTGVREDGTAEIDITIKELLLFLRDKEGIKYDFDSRRPTSDEDQLAKLIGKTYKISKTATGQVDVVNASQVRNAVKAGFPGELVKGLFEDKAIIQRHEILALPDADAGQIEVGGTWKRIKGSHPRLLDPKSFEKTYKLISVDEQNGEKIATIEMNAIESAVRAEDHPTTKGFGMFVKMFDAREKFTGILKLNLDTGDVVSYDETLDASYVAAEDMFETPVPGEENQEPDTLTMGFVNSIKLEKVNE